MSLHKQDKQKGYLQQNSLDLNKKQSDGISGNGVNFQEHDFDAYDGQDDSLKNNNNEKELSKTKLQAEEPRIFHRIEELHNENALHGLEFFPSFRGNNNESDVSPFCGGMLLTENFHTQRKQESHLCNISPDAYMTSVYFCDILTDPVFHASNIYLIKNSKNVLEYDHIKKGVFQFYDGHEVSSIMNIMIAWFYNMKYIKTLSSEFWEDMHTYVKRALFIVVSMWRFNNENHSIEDAGEDAPTVFAWLENKLNKKSNCNDLKCGDKRKKI